jgi:aquaporin Z
MKRYIAELIGTMVLVLFGCGSAAIAGSVLGNLGIALAFGLSIVAMAYSIGNVSGCHVNPAVSISMYFSGRMEGRECGMYCLFQCIGAIIGSAFLAALFGAGAMFDLTGGLGANGVDGVGGNFALATIVESVLTFIFVLTILGVTSEKAKHGSLAGLVIGPKVVSSAVI